MNVYPPREDTYFLLEFLKDKELEGKKFLEMGAGNGLISIQAAKKGAEVTAVDINSEALRRIELEAEEGLEIKTVESDLFNRVDGVFDLIVFNPPYLPGKKDMKGDETWKGGEKGVEVTERFLDGVNDYLDEEASVYVIVSSLSEYDDMVDEYGLEVVGEKGLWFEKLYILGK